MSGMRPDLVVNRLSSGGRKRAGQTVISSALEKAGTCRSVDFSDVDPHAARKIASPVARVVIVERQLLHYRVAFYNQLRAMLAETGVELQLLVGEGTAAEKTKKDEVTLDWAIRIPTAYIPGTKLCWQPFGRYANSADLVIVMHENRLLYNFWLLFFMRPKRIAFWGHGANMQSLNPNGIKERYKRWTVNKVDWWFAYTDISAAMVAGTGFARERITVVDNADDTAQLAELCREVGLTERLALRRDLKMEEGPVGMYLGSLYKEKRLDFLLCAAQEIRAQIPNFQLLIAGAGPAQEMIENAARKFSWIMYLGPLRGRDKAATLALADVILNPGLVGLGILDSFASGTPMITTDCGLHSPEICYLSSGHNGVMTANNVNVYADAVCNLLRQPAALEKLHTGALASASRYTVVNMAERICRGIYSCLSIQERL